MTDIWTRSQCLHVFSPSWTFSYPFRICFIHCRWSNFHRQILFCFQLGTPFVECLPQFWIPCCQNELSYCFPSLCATWWNKWQKDDSLFYSPPLRITGEGSVGWIYQLNFHTVKLYGILYKPTFVCSTVVVVFSESWINLNFTSGAKVVTHLGYTTYMIFK